MKRFALIFCLIFLYAQSANAKEIIMKCYAPKSKVSATFKLEKRFVFFSQIYLRQAGRWVKWCAGKAEIKDDTGYCQDEALGTSIIDFVDAKALMVNNVWDCY